MAAQQAFLLLRGELPVIWNPLVLAARDEIENIFLQIRAVQVIAWTLSARIISASDTPSSAVLIAPARVIIILPPRSRCAR
jgi:hypothetical protein